MYKIQSFLLVGLFAACSLAAMDTGFSDPEITHEQEEQLKPIVEKLEQHHQELDKFEANYLRYLHYLPQEDGTFLTPEHVNVLQRNYKKTLVNLAVCWDKILPIKKPYFVRNNSYCVPEGHDQNACLYRNVTTDTDMFRARYALIKYIEKGCMSDQACFHAIMEGVVKNMMPHYNDYRKGECLPYCDENHVRVSDPFAEDETFSIVRKTS